MRQVEKRTRGVAMLAALSLLAVASGVMLLLFMRTMDELRHGRDDAGIVQTLLAAHGGANIGVSLLRGDVRYALDDVVTDYSDTTGSWSFGDSSVNDTVPTPSSVAADMRAVAVVLQSQVDALVCGVRDLGDGITLTVRIHVTETACGQPLPADTRLGDGRFISGSRRELGGNQTYALPFVVVADGEQAEYRRRIVTQGEYQFEVGRRSFARYALFTDEHRGVDGSPIWFSSDTMFDGPVHTNGNHRFWGRPWFGGPVSSAGETDGASPGAYAYNGTHSGHFRSADSLEPGGNSPNMDRGGYTNRPQFTGGVDWRASEIELPENAFQQRDLAEEDGILITSEVQELLLFAGDEDGDPVDVGEASSYQFVRARMRDAGGNWAWVTWRVSADGKLERQQADGAWQLLTDRFNGVIYADDFIDRLRGPGRTSFEDPMSARPAVASFAQLTVVPGGGARITGDLVYEDQPCEGFLHRNDDGEIVRANCQNLDAKNVLGIFSPTEDILIGNVPWDTDSADSAPDDVRIQATVMSSAGVVTVENSGIGQPRGSVRLLGGIIEKRYGAFGRGGGAAGELVHGFGRQFTFDPRLGRGLTPPHFPLVGLDGVSDVRTFTFGHREQVY